MSLLQNSNAIEAGGYQISNSLRFQSASSQYATRTPSVASNRRTYTFSAWVKRGVLGSLQQIFASDNSSTSQSRLHFTASDTIQFISYISGFQIQLITTQVFRDPSAWYHVVLNVDTTQATSSNRVKLYINGTQVIAFSTATYPSLNYDSVINNNFPYYLGTYFNATSGEFLDGYMAEVNFIDGQALTPSSFGETNTLTGQWVAKKYTGTYGTNGFYLPFSNGTSTTTLGADSSGNGNNWTLNNFTRSAGVSDCWMYDVPSGNGGVSGTQPNSNYAVANPLIVNSYTESGGNLNISYASGAGNSGLGTIGINSSKWYFESVMTSANINMSIGWVSDDGSLYCTVYKSTVGGYHTVQFSSGSSSGTWDIANGQTLGVAFDYDNGAFYFYTNNSLAITVTGFSTGGKTFFPVYGAATSGGNAATWSMNFGNRSFAYTPPSGFKALCTANLPVATIKQGNKYMDATTYSGNLVGQSITNAGSFKPDLVWIKSRSAATDNKLTDSVRGAQTALVSNTTAAETTDLTGVVSFNTNGFTLGTSTTYNNTGATYVGWQWQAGQGSTSSNTSGSITSTTSVNATAGFSIVTYTTGAIASSATVGHGLGVAPSMIILKTRATTSTWVTYHQSLGNTKYIELNNTNGSATASTVWNNTSPTSSVFTIGTAFNNLGTMVAYCFAEIAGFSKFGSYTGNGSADGPFVYTNFKPKFIMIKRTDTAGFNWLIFDSARNSYNTNDKYLNPNTADAETSGFDKFDFLSNGFKARIADRAMNTNGATYIYAAFAESPFSSSNAA